MALSTSHVHSILGRHLRLVAALWLGRLGLLWVLEYPVYDALATSPLLHSQRSDQHLWKPGAELPLAIASSKWSALETLPASLWVIAAVALSTSLVLSSIAWRATAAPPSLHGIRLCLSATRRMPAFALLFAYTVSLLVALTWIWLDVVPLLGALFLPWLGERYTDLTQLAVFALLLVLTSGILMAADVARSMIALESVSVGKAIMLALGHMRSHALRIFLQASVRFGAWVLLQLAHLGLLARTGWLSRSGSHWIAALITTELVALVAISIRLHFMAWLVDFIRRKGGSDLMHFAAMVLGLTATT